MPNTIKMRTSLEGDKATVKALISHEMETGQRKDAKTGELIPAHFITELTATHNGKPVMQAQWGSAVSKNPFIEFAFSGGKPGDTVTMKWVDNEGQSDAAEAKLG